MTSNDLTVLPTKRNRDRRIAHATAIATVCCALIAQGCGSTPATEGESVGQTAAALTFAAAANATPSPGAAAITSWGGSRQDVFWIGSDTTLYHAWSNDQGASWGREPLFNGFLPGSRPAAAAAAPGRIDVAAIGISANDVRHVWYDGNGFHLERMADWDPTGFIVSDQTSLQGVAISSPWVNRVDLFFVAPDGAVHHRWTDNGWRLGNEPLYGHCVKSPSASATVWNRIDIVCSNSSYSIDHKYYNPLLGWSNWETLSSVLDLDSSVTSPRQLPVQYVYGAPAIASSPLDDLNGSQAARISIVFVENNYILRSLTNDVNSAATSWDRAGSFTSSSGGPGIQYGNRWTLNTFYSGAYAVAATNSGVTSVPTDDVVVLDNRGFLSTANYPIW